MKSFLIVANFKSHMINLEANNWLQEISNLKSQISNLNNKEIVVCPSFTLLDLFKNYIDEQKLPIELGAQDISPFDEGPYTGEVNGKQIKEFADFVIVGHSERRQNFLEDDEILKKKVLRVREAGLEPIFCIQNDVTFIPADVKIVAYEPVFAIGTGNPDTPKEAERIAKKTKEKGIEKVLYGGSVTSQNVKSFTNMDNIDGVLVGSASLDPLEFLKIIENA